MLNDQGGYGGTPNFNFFFIYLPFSLHRMYLITYLLSDEVWPTTRVQMVLVFLCPYHTGKLACTLTRKKKAQVVKSVNYWMKLSVVCAFMLTRVSVQYSKLCHTDHALLHPFTGGTSLQCAESSNWERSKHTHKAWLHTQTRTKHTHTHSLMYGMHECT